MNRENVEDIYRLSPIQQGMLFHTLYAPGEGVYFEQFNLRFGPGFAPALFERLWQQIVDHAPVLRTSFAWERLEEPVQIVHRRVKLPFEVLDWRGIPEEEKAAKLREYIAGERRRGFDLSNPPLIRFSSLRLRDDFFHVILSYHHAVLDGWSVGLLLQEVSALYPSALAGRPVQVQPRRPFRDYIAWLRQQDLSQSEAYWRRMLGGFTTPTPLGIDRIGRPAGQSGREDLDRDMKVALLPEEETEALKGWARQNRLTLSTVVQGAWTLVLSRYSGEDDLVFGVTVSGRPPSLPGVDTMLGCFINTLPVRVSVPAGESVLPWLQALQADQVELRRYEHSPLVQVLGWSDVPRPMPLFESIFVFEGFAGTAHEGVFQRTGYPLALVAGPDRELVLRIDYELERFEPAPVERLLGHLKAALSAFVAGPERRLVDVDVLTPEERRQLLTVWNRPAGEGREPLCLHRIFEARAERCPEAPAVTFENESLTYRELNERANRLAHHLRRLGVGPETRVGLCVERSFEMIEGILGILKAGGAYVPLDPRYPASRLALIAEDSGLDVLVTAEPLRGLVPGPAAVVCLDTAAPELARESGENPETPETPEGTAGPESLAYVIYTSGSTGRPKGSLLTHGNVARLFTETDAWFHFGPEDVWTLFHSFAFDFSVWEIWGALLYGGRLVVVPWWVSRSPEAFRKLLVREGVTVLNQTPSAFRQLVQADLEVAEGSFALRWVVFGGEALELASLAPWFERHGDRRPVLVNMYGITETTVHVTYREVTQADLAEAGRSPIGVPIPDLRVHLLDRHLNLVPVGVPGEMFVAGSGLARGYLGRPDLTAERFVPDRFGAPGERLYRSGDLARRLPGGELEYLGRIDHQVKIRGFRIELGEIEAALASHPAVREAVVLAREEPDGGRRLLAWVVPRPGMDLAMADLRSFLKERLPDYMVPAALAEIPAIPLTAHGKLDRRALPDPEAAAPVEKGFDPPRTPVEELLAGIWSRVLSVERVGRDDSFFDLGGHSLLATRVLSRLREVLQADLPLRALFEAPSIAELAPRVEAALAASRTELPPLRRQPREGLPPLSFSQERLWFLDQLQPGTAVYNIPGAVRMTGALDVAALGRALAEVVRRHEALRTVFTLHAGRPAQRIREDFQPALPLVDLAGLPPDLCGGREEEIRRLSREEASRPFDLAAGPLMRPTLLRSREGEHVMLLTFHHIVSDAWSMEVFLGELVALYEAFTAGAGRPSPLPELPVQYADFALWQRQWLDGAALEAQLAWWRERLAGVPVLQLPGDRPRPALQSFRGSMHSFTLPEPLSAALRAVTRARGATVFMTVLAAFQALLGRYSGQEDFAVGSPVAGRDQKEVEDLIGFFINTLVLRAPLAGDPEFAQLLDRVRAAALGAYAHQAVPFERVVQELSPERNLSYTPLFQAMLAFQNVPQERIELPGLTLTALADEFPISKFDLTLTAFDSGSQVFGQWVYSAALFEAATIARWAGHFQVLLEGLAADPRRRVSELPLLSSAEREQLLVEWNRPPADYPDEGFVHRLFEEQVAKTPDAVAVTFEGETLSYRELNARANRLARHLYRLGAAGPEALIAISAERSFEMVVGLLAILKTGSAYLPLDPSLPSERLAYMMEDGGIELLLAQERLLPFLPVDQGAVRTVVLDGGGPAGERSGDPAFPVFPESPAYVIYTSGSTGQPKGVVVSHRALGNRLQYARTGDVRAEDAFLQKTTISFDVSLLEIFAPLVIGGRTVLARPGGQQDPEYLLRLIREQRVTYTSFPPSLLYVLFEQEGFDQCDSLRVVITGGETVPAVLPGQFYERLPGADLLNRYGPTEATISTTSWLCERDGAPHSLPIGRPTAKARVYLLDARLQPVPAGVVGEIFLGGLCVARGYHRRPALTAEQFIPDPFSGEPGGRLYRTGDLARYRPDGAIEFVGRVDHQVKIRGFRVELGEIEAALARHPALREVAVIDREDGPTRSLAAYLVLQPGAPAAGEAELRGFLLETLPAYMVPADFVVLESLPLSPTGKVDRNALPEPGRRGAAGDFAPPRTQTEELLAAIWDGLLSSDRIGIDDSFFDLGGHSLLATQVMARVRETFGVDLPLRVFFEQPTVAALAGEIDAAVRAGAGVAAPPLVPVSRKEDLPLSFAQQRLWFLDQLQPGTATYNMPAALRFRGALDVSALHRSLREVVRRHEALRTTFALQGGSPVQSIAAEMALDLPLIDLRGLPEERREATVRRLAGEEGQRPFDLAAGPLIRAALLLAGEDEHVALLTLHHIVADGWSIEVLIREIGALYPAFLLGEASVLPELPVQYADFAVWQRQWLQGEVLEAQLGYWRQVLAGHSVLQFPTDRLRPAVQKYTGADEPLALPAEVSQAFLDLGRRQSATPYMALMAGFQALLHRYSGQDDVIVGATVAGRDRRELEPLIGFFVNILPVRTSLSGRPGFQALLARVREAALGALSHQDLPFEKLVQELQLERDLSRSPLFQMVFQLQQAVSSNLELPGLMLSPVPASSQTAKFDIVLNLRQGPQGLTGVWQYNTSLFDRATLSRLSRHFENLLAGAAADPARPLPELPLLTEAERQQLGLEWNAALAESLAGPGLHEIFAARAVSTPEAVAVVCEGERLSYGELDRRANQVANHLIRLGVSPGELVGLCLERSVGMVVALLGVLKAGGAYVPLDPAYPRERLAFMLEDSRVPVLLAHQSLAETLPQPGPATRVVFMGGEPFAGESDVDPEVTVSAGHPAYVIYTSGSTGRPKGVVVRHGNAVRLFSATEHWFGFGPEDVWTLFHSYAFDFSVWELWGALLYGGRLVVVPWRTSRSPEAFYELLRQERVTVLNQTPSAFRQLIRAEEPALAGAPDLALRYVIFGGEALEPASLAPWFERHGDQHPRLINMYGITETTVHVTYRPVERQDVNSVIGRPIPDLGLYVLDGELQPLPVGVPGEIHVGGAGLALGYLGRPELTAERFVPNPWGEPGSRLYRSGDLARYLPDGGLEYLGRIDHQVKIRGFRIELGEIESALAAHPAVREAVVLARDSVISAGEKRLVAYVVPAAGAAPNLTELRTALAGSLPDYMLPSALVVLEKLPLTTNGKVDRRALPEPEAEWARLESSYVAPATALESFLAGLWQEVLGVPRVGVHDNFFELGGSSITGAVLVNRLQEELRRIVHVVVIFDAPTVAKMAAYLIGQYPRAVAGLFGPEALGRSELVLEAGAAAALGEAEVKELRGLIRPLAPLERSLRKNPSAVFVLSPPRSGSTLMRVMLGGHPRLFSPPELELLSFNTLRERRAAFSGRDSFWLEGVIRALMEVRSCGAEEAEELLAEAERQDLTTLELYGRLQDWLGDRILVDKTPSYALDPAMLRRAEEGFEEPHYIHLIRHPLGMIHSFEEARLDQIFFRYDHPFSRRQLAELIWRVSHENIVEFLAGVPACRQHWVRFEDLLSEPEQTLRDLCGSLGLDYHPDMAEPYKKKSARMTDGVYAESRMLGDVKFHQHKGVDRGVAERWREDYRQDFLGEGTWRLAARLGYQNESGRADAGLAPIKPGEWREGEPLPLSFAQERLWFFDQMEPGSPVYHIPAVFRLAGRLDAAALGASLREVVRRHAALRTDFSLAGGQPVQIVHPEAEVPLRVYDLAALPREQREEEALRLAYALVRQPFDLSHGPLLRAALLRLGEEEHSVVLTMHHIVSDGWSMGVLMREVAALYRAFVAGEPSLSPLPGLPIQYPDYALWQRRWLAGEALKRQIAFWKGNLAGAPTLQLPTDRPRPRIQTYRGGMETFRLPAELSGPLARLGRSRGATPFMALLAGYAALLARYSGQADVSVGSPVANRSRAETEPLIGLFINMVVLRNDLSGDPGFRELLARVRGSALAAFRHQEMPFARVVEEVQPERDLSRAPLFQVMLVQQNNLGGLGGSGEPMALPGLTLEPQQGLEGSTSKVDLTLSFTETPLGLAGPLYYNRDLYDAATVARFAGHLGTLLAAAVAHPELPLSELPLLTPGEERQIVDWNDTAVSYPTDVCLHELIEDRLESDPDRVAAVFEGASLTGRELNAVANRLAHRLTGMGVGPEVPVGVFAERSLEMVVALLAILKAGGAYLPLDPEYPEDRILYMLESSRVPVLLTQSRLAERLPQTGARVVFLDASEVGTEETNPASGVRPVNLAYVIYTSGSTGRPKGVMNTHRGIVNRLLWMQQEYGLTPEDRVLQKTPFSFDVSVWELFWPLMTGARLVMARPGGHQDAAYLTRTIQAEGITTLHFVPSMLQVFLEAPGVEACASLIRVIASGEALPYELQRRFFRRLSPGGAELHNLYGPTEAAVDVTYWACEAEGKRSVVPIGRPVANTRIHLLDASLRPVPVGVPGELHIGGVQVARGYLGRPELTAERFIPDPFSSNSGARLYKTGDLARYLPDGAVDFLGRIDHQVKLRGLRIELEEIEAAIAAHPGVREAVVLVRAEGSGALGAVNLVAYVTRSGAEEPTPAALRALLARSLPEYMVPSSWVVLDELPLSPNGKVDRKALSRIAPERTAGGPAEKVAPRTEMERALTALWSEVLGLPADGVDAFGIHDNFFELGGNSITGAIFINRLQQTLGEIVHVVAVFDAPTIASLAASLAKDYPEAVARVWGPESLGEARLGTSAQISRPLDEERLAEVRSLIRTLPSARSAAPRNPPALFVLSPPRSGSTLLRVMLGGHPGLFAPPELELLNFNTLAERREAFSGRDAFRLEGLLRAVMEIRGQGPDDARALVERFERGGMTTQELYRRLQDWIGPRLLVDKTPTYAWDPATLRRAEEAFGEARYLHLVRHPYGMIRSFEEARIDQIFFHEDHTFSRRELAEALWTIAHRNVLEFLAEVPEERQHTVRFEDLLRDPEDVLLRICAFLGLEYHPDMAEPYKKKSERMTDGLHAESRMLGDVKFHEHKTVDRDVAEGWRRHYNRDFLGGATWRIAARLGYDPEKERVGPGALPPAMVKLRPGSSPRPLFLVHPLSGELLLYRHLIQGLAPDQAVYGFQARGFMEGDPPLETIEEMADLYVESLLAFQPEGPYLLAGSSMGGVIAFEMARRLQGLGREVALAALLDAPPPGRAAKDDGPGEAEMDVLRYATGGRTARSLDDLLQLTPDQRLELILAEGREAGGLATGMGLPELRRLVRILEANRRALRAYRPEPAGVRATYVRAAEGVRADAAWEPLALGGLEVHEVSGSHLSMHVPPHVHALAARLASCIERAAGETAEEGVSPVEAPAP